eukprot:525859_1
MITYVIIFVVLEFVYANRLLKLSKTNISKYSNNNFIDFRYGSGGITGFVPSGTDTYPLFVWVTGTQMNHWTNDDIIYCNYMANAGFAAVSLDYQGRGLFPLTCGADNSDSDTNWAGKARLLWNSDNPFSALSVLCNPDFNENTSRIDCNKGIILAGFSQGAQLVSLAGNWGFDALIKGIYQMGGGWKLYNIINFEFDCLRYENTKIDDTRIRSCVGAWDGYFGENPEGVFDEQRIITNRCTSGPLTYNCLQSDGSGFYIVQSEEVETGNAVHCYAYENEDCHANDGSPEFDLAYDPGNVESNRFWSLSANLDWLIAKGLSVQ